MSDTIEARLAAQRAEFERRLAEERAEAQKRLERERAEAQKRLEREQAERAEAQKKLEREQAERAEAERKLEDALAEAQKKLEREQAEAQKRLEREQAERAEAQRKAEEGAAATLEAAALKSELERLAFIDTDCAHYEFPYFEHSTDSHLAKSLREAGVRARPGLARGETLNEPDLLLSALDQSVVKLCEMTYLDSERRLSLTVDGQRYKEVMSPRIGQAFYVALVGTSGAGKTRFLLETAYSQYACLLWTSGMCGSKDLESFSRTFSSDKLNQEAAHQARQRVRKGIFNIIAIRAFVLKYLREHVPGFAPRHWMAVQYAPIFFFGSDIFASLLEYVRERTILRARDLYAQSKMSFIAIDEAQIFEQGWRGVFPSRNEGPARSLLSPIVDAFMEMGFGVVLAGTGLHIVSSIETIGSSMAKADRETAKRVVYGVVNSFGPNDIRRVFKDRGYDRLSLSDEELESFRGRPRFGMRLLEGLLLGKSAGDVRSALLDHAQGLLQKTASVFLDVEGTSKNLLGELNTAAVRMILKSDGGLTVGGETALEIGVCNIRTKEADERKHPQLTSSSTVRVCSFEIDEPIVLEAIEKRGIPLLEDATNENALVLGYALEDYVAYNAREILSVLSTDAVDHRFRGPWTLLEPRHDRLRGTMVSNGEEVAELELVVERVRQGHRGKYIIFPGLDFGADIIVCARNGSGDVLLSLIQCKARARTSTPGAMRSLQLPYHVKREGARPQVPDKYRPQLKLLEEIMRRDYVKVAFVVFKYPARSGRLVKPFKVVQEKGWSEQEGSFPVLQVILDGKSVPELCPERIVKTLARLDALKSLASKRKKTKKS